MFFAARSCGPAGRWGIAAAVSVDGGWTWRPLGWALREPAADLLGATAFQHNGTVRCSSRGGVGGRGTRAAHAVIWRTTEGLQRRRAPASKLCMHPLSLPLPALPSLSVRTVRAPVPTHPATLQWFLVPEVAGRRQVTLYRASHFPTAWELHSVLLEAAQPLQGLGIVQHSGQWWLLGSLPGTRQGEARGLQDRAAGS